ncbi:MAG: RNA polymerase sigma factor [Planctomycetota bacterium]|jgi:RNA polymerase sigma-70 factor (ECF subfamily)
MQTPAPDADTAADTTAHAVVEHLEDVRAWCLIRSGDPHLAEDIMQETALAALRQLPTLRDPERLRGWLFRIAQRRLADAARTRPVEVPLTVEPPAPAADGPPCTDAQKLRLARRAMRRLPLFLRKPVRLHYLQGRPLREVAHRLDTTVNGVKARLYRARRLMREATRR